MPAKKQPKKEVKAKPKAIKPIKSKKPLKQKSKISSHFVYILAIISIIGFLGIIVDSFFQINIDEYVTFLWLIVMGIGFILISKPKDLYEGTKLGFDETKISRLTAFVIGILAIIAGVLSIPQIGIEHPVFLAIKGVVSIISIIFIVIQTWLIHN